MTSTKYIWNWGLNFLADVGYSGFDNVTRPAAGRILEIDDGDVIWLRSPDLPWFFEEILPQLKRTFILLSADSDWSVPRQLQAGKDFNLARILGDSRLLHWFAQNCDYNGVSSKISPLPIGLDYHTLVKGPFWGEPQKTPVDQEAELERLLADLKPTADRLQMVYTDIHLNNSSRDSRNLLGEDRIDIARKLDASGCAQFQSRRMRRRVHWKLKGQYAFSISVFGNGMDCHRTWESLVLGNIVIVKTSALDALYRGLPVVIVSDWSEITRDNLDKWLEQFADAFDNPNYRERLTNRFWMDKVRSYRKIYARNGD